MSRRGKQGCQTPGVDDGGGFIGKPIQADEGVSKRGGNSKGIPRASHQNTLWVG